MSRVEPLDELGLALGQALRRELPKARRRRRVLGVGTLLAAVFAVPAAGTVTRWAGLAGGETALPTQVAEGLRLPLARGVDGAGPWRLEVYRAALAGSGSRAGVCVFIVREQGGTGRCVAEPGAFVDAGQDEIARIGGGIVDARVTRVEVTTKRYGSGRRDVRAVTPEPAPAAELSKRGLPEGLRSYAVAPDQRRAIIVGVRALDAAGRTVGTSGTPAAPASTIASSPSPLRLGAP